MTMPPMTSALVLTAGVLMGVGCNDSNGPPAPVANVTVSPSLTSVLVGGTMQLTAKTADAAGNVLAGRAVTWASGNLAVATVSENGLVTGVSSGGPVTITATSEGHQGTATITVTTTTATTGAIAFTSDRDGNAEIYVMNADGSNPTRLTNNPAADLDPAWSPDGTKIAFASNRDGNYTIYVMNADGSNPRRLTAGRAPAWSPDGKKIAFAVDVGAGVEGELSYVYSMNEDGTGGTYIAGDYWPYEAASEPAWSPDGARLALRLREFWDEGGYYTSIVVMHADGTNWHYVAYSSDDGGGTVASPAWSPDGTKITFISYGRVAVVGADGSGAHSLATETENNESSVWSPDGTQIAFAGACIEGCSGALDIYVMNADGSGVVRLTHTGSNYSPAWRP